MSGQGDEVVGARVFLNGRGPGRPGGPACSSYALPRAVPSSTSPGHPVRVALLTASVPGNLYEV
ncbi:hypothetical protein, partial [Nocardioides kongjuensis]|uniref:hypothetical protein n=1 Tax=Nocardioides kongjuensis TaxID=349522 RepID=UPI0031E4F239